MTKKAPDRVKLRNKLGRECEGSGRIVKFSSYPYTMGFNLKDKRSVLLKEVTIDKNYYKHIWVHCAELYSYKINSQITFKATVISYSKKNGSIEFGVNQLREITLI